MLSRLAALFGGLLLAAVLGLSGGTTAAEQALKLHPRVSAAFEQYLSRWNPMYFAISEDGLWAGYVTCNSSSWGCRDRDGRSAAVKLCQKVSGGTAACKIYARGKTIVWKGRVIEASEANLASDLPPAQTLLANFEKIAFHSEFEDQGGARPLIKWHEPIRIAIHGENPSKYRSQVEDFAAELAGITGHSLTVGGRRGGQGSDASGDINVRFYFTRSIFEAAAGRYLSSVSRNLLDRVDVAGSAADLSETGSTCFALITAAERDSAEIARAVIFIPSNLSRKVTQACVVEELTQVLGLIVDSDDVYPSIFNDCSPFYDLTEHDKRLLRLLFDDRLKAGMSWRDVRPIAERILGELAEQGS